MIEVVEIREVSTGRAVTKVTKESFCKRGITEPGYYGEFVSILRSEYIELFVR